MLRNGIQEENVVTNSNSKSTSYIMGLGKFDNNQKVNLNKDGNKDGNY